MGIENEVKSNYISFIETVCSIIVYGEKWNEMIACYKISFLHANQHLRAITMTTFWCKSFYKLYINKIFWILLSHKNYKSFLNTQHFFEFL